MLQSFIEREKNSEYHAIIRNEKKNIWNLLSQRNKTEAFMYNSKKYYYPNIAIYKGFE